MEPVRIDEIQFFNIGKYEFQVVRVDHFNVYFLVGSLGEDVYQPLKRNEIAWNSNCLGGKGEIRLFDSPRDAIFEAIIFVRGKEYEKEGNL